MRIIYNTINPIYRLLHHTTRGQAPEPTHLNHYISLPNITSQEAATLQQRSPKSMKLELIKAADVGEFEDNSEFHWDSALRGPKINPEVEEMASELYRCGDYDAAAAAFTLLTESFPSPG